MTLNRTVLVLLCITISSWLPQYSRAETKNDIVQAQIVLTVSESKRLIAKAVASLPEVLEAKQHGTIVIAKGSTNSYVAEEILGENINKNGYVMGAVIPSKVGGWPGFDPEMGEIILRNGTLDKDLDLAAAAGILEPGDVVIKGGNALDYEKRLVGVMVGSPTGGTIGKIIPSAVGRKAHIIIPIGLEKLVAGNIVDISNEMRRPVLGAGNIPSMFLLSGTIITEIEAIELLAGVEAFQAAAGGLSGAEGAVWLIVRGQQSSVDTALEIVADIHGEPPFPQ